LAEDDFWSAIDENIEIEVMHTVDDGDHHWTLNEHEKEKLRTDRAKGLI
jgi:hypothetical protein